MRKLYLLVILSLLSVTFSWAIHEKIGLETSNGNHELVVTAKTPTSIRMVNSIGTIQLSEVNTKAGDFVELWSKGYYKNLELAAPMLPLMNKMIEIPQGAEIVISVLKFDEEVIDLSSYGINHPILPVQASLFKDQDPDDVEFLMNKSIYNSNEVYSLETARVEYIGETRGVKMGRLSISPFSYNPQTNQLIVKNNLEIEITFKNADLQLTKSIKQKFYSPAFNSVFESLISVESTSTRDAIVEYGPVKYVIVADRMFETELEPFVTWKTQKGFNVIQAYTDVIGTSTTAIKTYLQDLYENPADGISPSYLLFVGDIDQIPAWESLNTNPNYADHITDLYYAEYTGDNIPEVYYGRFSANNVAQLTPQIEKTLEYERFEMADPSYLNDVVLVAGADANFAPKHGNGQINYANQEYFNEAHGFSTVHKYLFGSGTPITSDQNGASAAIQANISAGAGFVNYTAHCNWDGWSDPSFSVYDVDGLDNEGKYPLMIGNCCLSNKFDTPNNGGTCFGEEVMRADGKGVIGYIGGSNSTLWDEDFYWGVGVNQINITPANSASHTYANTGLGAYDGTFHENGEVQAEWYVSSSQMMFFGNMSVTAGGSNVLYYWEIYHLMGDPSLMAYFTVPEAIIATHSNAIVMGANQLMVQTDAPLSYIAVSKEGVLLDAQLADAEGNVMLSFEAINALGTLDVVVSKQNRAPYIGTLTVIEGTEPPVAAFEANTVEVWEGETIQFTDLTTQGPTEWAWNFGDESTSDVQYPAHIYADEGTYTVTLTAVNNIGEDTEEKLAYILVNALTEVPVVDFEADETSILVSEEVQFTDLSTLLATAWAWDFGDGSTATEQHPSHIYSEAGMYTVSLTATNAVGPGVLTKTDYIEVSLEPYCDASSSRTSSENIENVTFGSIDNSTGSDGYADYTALSTDVYLGGAETISISYDENYSSDEVMAWIDWNQNNSFEADEKYEIGNGSGNNSPYSQIIEVPVNAVLGMTRLRVRLNDTSYDSNSEPCGESAYGEVEDYSVNVVELTAAPVVAFEANVTEVVVGEVIQFTDLSTQNPMEWLWDFGDEVTSDQQNPTHSYTTEGIYTVTLTASNTVAPGHLTKSDYIIVTEDSGVAVGILGKEKLLIYPNPTNNVLNLKSQLKQFKYKFVALDGRVVLAGEIANENEVQFNVSSLAEGIYTLWIQYPAGQLIRKVVKK